MGIGLVLAVSAYYADNIPQLISDCGFASWEIGSAISGDRSVVWSYEAASAGSKWLFGRAMAIVADADGHPLQYGHLLFADPGRPLHALLDHAAGGLGTVQRFTARFGVAGAGRGTNLARLVLAAAAFGASLAVARALTMLVQMIDRVATILGVADLPLVGTKDIFRGALVRRHVDRLAGEHQFAHLMAMGVAAAAVAALLAGAGDLADQTRQAECRDERQDGISLEHSRSLPAAVVAGTGDAVRLGGIYLCRPRAGRFCVRIPCGDARTPRI
jgi:hypothetical protein